MKKIHITTVTFLLLSYSDVFAQSVTYNYTGSVKTFTVPPCVTSITIDARGAQGGGASGGLGAWMVGTFAVTNGEVLNILVGSRGGLNIGEGAGGGGGSFVADILNNPLIVAGGGGGQGSSGAGNPGNITLTGSNGTQPISGGVGGTNGGGGGGASDNGSCISGGGGGGFCGNGGEASNGGSPGAGGLGCLNGGNGSSGTLCPSGIGLSYLNGGAGGVGCSIGGCSPVNGGYGGGGGTAGGGGAGGGGYSGGGGGGWNSGTPSGGGGGGSFNNGTNQSNTTGFQSGDGQVTITWVASSGISFSSKDSTAVSCNGKSDGSASVTMSGGTLPYTYLWTPSAQTNATATGLTAGVYTVNISDAAGCTASVSMAITQPAAINTVVSSVPADSACTGQSVVINASGNATNYIWSSGATTSTISVIIPAGDTAYYWVKGIVGACYDSVRLKIKIIPVVTATATVVSDSVCPHGSSTILVTAAGGQATYKWSNGATTSSITVNDTVTTTYTATVYGLCDSTKVMKTITVIPLPKPVITGTKWKCAGMKDTLNVSSSINPTTYKWSSGSTSTSYYTGNINSDSLIYVVAENSLGCPVKDSFKITEIGYPGGTVKYIPGCGNTSTHITVNAFGPGPYTYLWNTGGTNDTINVNIDSTTTYTVVVSNGCATKKVAVVTPYFPSISACCNASINIGGDTIIKATGTAIVSYKWAPGTGLNCDTCPNVTATPTTTTTYTVTGTDANGCTISQLITITVDAPCFNFTVPNVFTPTNPGILGVDNEFYINTTYSNLSSWSVIIFDRWGKEMFNNTNPSQYWKGNTESGGEAPAGVYYYLIDGVCSGTTYKKDGYVQLIR